LERKAKNSKIWQNSRRLVIVARQGISRLIIDIPTVMKVIIWVGVKERESAQVKVCIGFVYNAPQSSKWYSLTKISRETKKR
jgi:hypothetical protein